MKRRLDGKKILVSFTAQQTADMRQYRREYGIKSENEFIRQAIVHYMDKDNSDNTLKLSSLKTVNDSLAKIVDILSVLFSYVHHMHGNLLAYHSEIDGGLKDAAYNSAQRRLEKFYVSFQENLKDDPSFFEKLLHKYVTGSL